MWETLKYLVGPGLLLLIWKRLVLVRVTTHVAFVFPRPVSWTLAEVFAYGGNPERITVSHRSTETPTVAMASAMALEDIPAGAVRTRALFIRAINDSPERSITVNGIWIEVPGRRIPIIVPNGQITIAPKRRWEAWVPLESVRSAVSYEGDMYTSVRVRVGEKRRLLSSVRAQPDEVAPVGELATSA